MPAEYAVALQPNSRVIGISSRLKAISGRMLEPNSVPSSTTSAMRILRGEKSDSLCRLRAALRLYRRIHDSPRGQTPPIIAGLDAARTPFGAIHS